jgi:hypothetical protein
MRQLAWSGFTEMTGPNFVRCLLAALSLVWALPLHAADCGGQHDCELVQRFRPFILSSNQGSTPEQFHPVTWQNFVQLASLTEGSKTLIPTLSVQWDPADNFLNLVKYSADLAIDSSDTGAELVTGSFGGEDWASVANGDGVYGHVERIGIAPASGTPDTRLVNIDYTIIWSFNLASAPNGAANHDGDITFLVVLYDPIADRIVRITYPQHGCALDLYQLSANPTTVEKILNVVDVNGAAASHEVITLDIDSAHEADDRRGNCTWGAYTAPDKNLSLAADFSVNGSLYEHPVIFAEYGSHESWPNSSGSLTYAGTHNGLGNSWMPAFVKTLAAFDAPMNQDTAFLHYNGKFGTDPQTLVLHDTWCWPTVSLDPAATVNPTHLSVPCVYTNHRLDGSIINSGNGDIPANRFADMMPYENKQTLNWPPPREINLTGDVYVSPANGQSGSGTQDSPYRSLKAAASLAPARWTLHLQSGNYPGSIVLSRAINLLAEDGKAIIGR